MTSRDLESIYQRLGIPLPEGIVTHSQTKYRSRWKAVDGILFQSTGEALCYRHLKLLEQAGAITDLVLQPAYVLQEAFRDEQGKAHRRIEYHADFRFRREGETVVVDYKGIVTPVFALKRKLFQRRFPQITFEIWNKSTLAGL